MTFILISTDDDVDFTEITVQEHLPGMPEIEIVIMMIRMMHDDTDADVNLTEISVQEHLPKMPEMMIMMIIVIIEIMIRMMMIRLILILILISLVFVRHILSTTIILQGQDAENSDY